MISIIVAMAHDNVIGKSNGIPWYIPADLKHFKDITLGHTVMMGQNTYESIVARLSKPLPQRRNIVITRDENLQAPGCEIAYSIEDALRIADREGFVIGGAMIYRQMIDIADRLYITEIDADIDGDVHFPLIDADKWREISRKPHESDDKNPYPYSFVTYTRI